MSGATVTPERLLPHLTAWLERGPSRPIFAIHHVGDWRGKEQLSVAGRNVDVRVCPSELAVREELARPREEGRGLVLLTPVEQLGEDVLARLARPRVHRLLAHEALLPLFGVKGLDPQLARQRWLVDALVDSAPTGGYEPSGSVQLDLARAWRALLVHRYGYDPDTGLGGLVAWATTADAQRLVSAPDEERDAVAQRLRHTVNGSDGVLAAIMAGSGGEVPALGLVARALLDGADGSVRVAARTRFEVRCGWTFDEPAARAWAQAAEARLATLDESDRQAEQQRAERLVAAMQAGDLVGASDVLLAGLRWRLAALGDAVATRLDGVASVGSVERAADAVASHDLAEPTAAELAAMTTRLVRWLARETTSDADLRGASARYVAHGAYVDWARAALRRGGGEPTLDAALRRLVEIADEARERDETAFAAHLAGWAQHAALDDELLGVEHVLARMVAPLAAARPVLVVVLDGMSHRVAAELLETLVRDGWIELRRGSHRRRALVVSALPSVTTFSRASLLSGRPTQGLAKDEVEAFAEHPELAAASARQPPRLFHKGGLTDPRGGLTGELREEIGGDRRVLGVVVNAIDDHLARSDQLRTAWSPRDILPLGWLLDEARSAQRLVVLVSDHGHVIEHGTQLHRSPPGGGERWRPHGNIEVGQGEVAVTGTRVLASGGSCVLASGDRVRYGPKKNGYHGGASAQEVLAPVMVLSAGVADTVASWQEVAHDPPGWWSGEQAAPTTEAPAPAPPGADPRPGEQLTFKAEPAALGAAASWIRELLGSDVFAAQRAAGGRTPVSDERIATILGALDAHGGTMLLDALARTCGLPALRLTGTLAALRQMLNVDGYAVLDVDEASRDVRLDRDLLVRQFELGGG